MDNDQLKQLIEKYKAGKATPQEIDFLDAYYKAFELRPDFTADTNDEQQDKLWANIKAEIDVRIDKQQNQAKTVRLWPRIAAAASILLMLSFGGYFLIHKKPSNHQIALLKPGTFKNDVLPGKNKAYITLANGRRVVVNTTASGSLAQQGNTNIQKNANGEVVYQTSATPAAEVAYNTFTTPRGGGKQRLVLADGTVAVLDAGSSLRYPVAFTGKDRKVSMTGRVYFEVTHQDAHPFFLTAKNQTIEDLGTHFNVDAFDDEPEAKTTLLEGSVRINGKTLKPGQQAIISANGQTSINNTVDEEEVMAWKNDLFRFTNNTSLTAVMRQLSRWYDLEVVYQGKGNKDYHFGGFVPRNSKLSEVLRILELSGVQFALDGKKIIVYQ